MSDESERPVIDVVVKLGGAAVTDKSKRETLKEDALRWCAEAVSSAYQRCSSVVVIHGAGSFGHISAKESRIQQGESSAFGAAETAASVRRLNVLVVDALLARGVPAVGLSPRGSWTTSSRDLVHQAATEQLRALLRRGAVPVVHGDVVMDEQQQWAILSGDKIAEEIVRHMGAQRVVFVSDVAGVYTGDPRADATARHLPTLSRAQCTALARDGGDSDDRADVTGGMAAKLDAAFASAALGARVFVGAAHSAGLRAVLVDGPRESVSEVTEVLAE